MIALGVIGTGWITRDFVAHAEATKQWKLAAVYSRKEETAKEFGAKFGVDRVHTSTGALFNDSDVQAVYIASPNSLHYEQAKQALIAGKHVILEKPATSTVAEFEELCALAARQSLFLIEAWRHIQEANFHVLKSNISKLGPILGGHVVMAKYSSRYDEVLKGGEPNIFSLKFSGGCLVDMGCYPVMFAVALFGQPKGQTYAPIIIESTGADAGGVIVLRYEGFAVSINTSKCYTSTTATEIYGHNGTIVVNGATGCTDIDKVDFVNLKTKKTEQLATQKAELNLQEEAAEFARIINEKDTGAAQKLEELSGIVLRITTDLRKQNGIVFDVEK